jgi:hypothetical protein
VAPQAERDPDWKRGMNGLQKLDVYDPKKKTKTVVDVYPLKGDVVDDATNEPVYYFWSYLIPPERGDVVEAAKGWTPSRFRNGQFALERQPAGVYNMLCESREHDAWKGQVKIPYEGDLRIRLKHGTAIIGTVTDSSQTPPRASAWSSSSTPRGSTAAPTRRSSASAPPTRWATTPSTRSRPASTDSRRSSTATSSRTSRSSGSTPARR